MGHEKYEGLINPGKKHFNGVVKIHPNVLQVPLEKKKPTLFFVNSMSDLFHAEVPEAFITDVFEVMARTPRHTYQILTKRPERIQDLMPRIWQNVHRRLDRDGKFCDTTLPNVWLGTSVEDENTLERIEPLRRTPAAIRFLSCEPLLGPLGTLELAGIDWVIIGGESGPKSRPLNIRWAEDIIEQCDAGKVACFVKQLGARPFVLEGSSSSHREFLPLQSSKGGDPEEWPPRLRVREYPNVHSVA
jgi:protein gp37